MPSRSLLGLAALLALVALAGCGDDAGDGASRASGTATATSAQGSSPLARRPAGRGEFVVSGDASPATHGPYTFDGRYLVRFEQHAPEDPALDFSSQTPFTAALTRRRDDARGATALFQAARRSGRRDLAIHGRYYVDVSFGDFPYVIRFTPRAR